MSDTPRERASRRRFLKSAALASSALGFPSIVPSSVLGAEAPSNQITIGAIGVGRISRGHDMPGIWKHARARITAVCDLDARRLDDARTLVNAQYAKTTGKPYDGVTGYADYRELLANRDIDAVVISTPDHWHAAIAIAAARAGKDIYLQKPASLTIAEGRALSDAVHRSGVIFQIGSQQRSQVQFRRACELVRNGRIGQVKTVQVGLPGDPAGSVEAEMPVPAGFNYDMWLGSTPRVYYTEKRVHPQAGYDRPGWLRCEQFGAGMITGWGAHHIDTAHWGMGTEFTGPVEIWGKAEFPTSGLWNVHGAFRTEARYANGVVMTVSGDFPNGIRFEGTDGWIFVSRGNETVTASDPTAKLKDAQALAASDPRILDSEIGADGVHLYVSADHHGNWLDCIRTRQQPIAPVEVAHRACTACLLHHISMKLPRRLHWDPVRERFQNDDEANALLSRPQRVPYGLPT
jgi:predicted dehydrogenase